LNALLMSSGSVQTARLASSTEPVTDLIFHLEHEMRNLTKKFVTFLKREDGPTAVEYAVMLALIIVVCIAAVTTLGSNANNTFSNVAGKATPAGGS